MTELEKVCELLNTNRYNSKDWVSGNIVDRVEWLIAMYENKKQEIVFLTEQADEMAIELELYEGMKNEIVSRISNLEASISSLQRNM